MYIGVYFLFLCRILTISSHFSLYLDIVETLLLMLIMYTVFFSLGLCWWTTSLYSMSSLLIAFPTI